MGAWEAPGYLKARFPEVGDRWTWLSALRLQGEAPQGIILVAVDRNRTSLRGRWLTQDEAGRPGLVARIYGKLRVELCVDIAHRIACEDGTPVRAEHNIKWCVRCGEKWDVHDGNGTPR
ncbi:hypothetical protein ACU635_33295 [[Actinomadura] parvosata]|uniref:hypothetical protein n=1 Tax=[Actinomadura] parvosata TaxID=1955412 RepID=UPI00406C0A93